MNLKILGLIVARGGSKSIPQKNIFPLGGKPLLQWCYEAALRSKSITRIVCSTEDDNIATLCQHIGLEVCHRPEILARDNTPPFPVIVDALEQLERKDYFPDALFLIQPTSPFVRPENFDTAVEILLQHEEYAGVQSIRRVPHNYHAYNQRTFKNGEVKFAFHKLRMKYYNKQLKPDFYVWGNIFLARTKELFLQKTLFVQPTGGFFVSDLESIDIDYPEDISTAEHIIHMNSYNITSTK